MEGIDRVLTMLQKKDAHYGEAQFYAVLLLGRPAISSTLWRTLIPLADEKVMPLVGRLQQRRRSFCGSCA